MYINVCVYVQGLTARGSHGDVPGRKPLPRKWNDIRVLMWALSFLKETKFVRPPSFSTAPYRLRNAVLLVSLNTLWNTYDVPDRSFRLRAPVVFRERRLLRTPIYFFLYPVPNRPGKYSTESWSFPRYRFGPFGYWRPTEIPIYTERFYPRIVHVCNRDHCA